MYKVIEYDGLHFAGGVLYGLPWADVVLDENRNRDIRSNEKPVPDLTRLTVLPDPTSETGNVHVEDLNPEKDVAITTHIVTDDGKPSYGVIVKHNSVLFRFLYGDGLTIVHAHTVNKRNIGQTITEYLHEQASRKDALPYGLCNKSESGQLLRIITQSVRTTGLDVKGVGYYGNAGLGVRIAARHSTHGFTKQETSSQFQYPDNKTNRTLHELIPMLKAGFDPEKDMEWINGFRDLEDSMPGWQSLQNLKSYGFPYSVVRKYVDTLESMVKNDGLVFKNMDEPPATDVELKTLMITRAARWALQVNNLFDVLRLFEVGLSVFAVDDFLRKPQHEWAIIDMMKQLQQPKI